MAKDKTKAAMRRDDRLATVRTQINLLRSALLDLAQDINVGVFPVDETTWPNDKDPDAYVTAMKRLKLLAEIAYAMGFAVDHITEMDLKPAAEYARRCVIRFNGKPAKGWDKPLGRTRTAPAKDALLELVRFARTEAKKKGTSPAISIERALLRWFLWSGGTDAGARELIERLPVRRSDKDFSTKLTQVVASIPGIATVAEEVVIKAVWKGLGADEGVIRNLYSHLDKREKRSTPISRKK